MPSRAEQRCVVRSCSCGSVWKRCERRAVTNSPPCLRALWSVRASGQKPGGDGPGRRQVERALRVRSCRGGDHSRPGRGGASAPRHGGPSRAPWGLRTGGGWRAPGASPRPRPRRRAHLPHAPGSQAGVSGAFARPCPAHTQRAASAVAQVWARCYRPRGSRVSRVNEVVECRGALCVRGERGAAPTPVQT